MFPEKLNTDIFCISHLCEKDLLDLDDFRIANRNGKGLEYYLKQLAYKEEKCNFARTYLVRNSATNEIVAYFTLKTGLITRKTRRICFDNITGIELANFAVNDAYRMYNDVIPQIGKYIFITFIYPLTKEITTLIGAQCLYVFALPQKRLISYYGDMGFKRFPPKLERFVHKHIRPAYDKGCIIMCQKIK